MSNFVCAGYSVDQGAKKVDKSIKFKYVYMKLFAFKRVIIHFNLDPALQFLF